jgi:hypothetical protein
VRNGRVAAVEHRVLDLVRWSQIRVPLLEETDFDGALARAGRALAAELEAADGRPLAARVTFCGPTPLHGRLLGAAEPVRQGVIAEGRHFGTDRIWIEQVKIATAPLLDFADLRRRPDAVGRLVGSLDGLVEEAVADLFGDYPQRLRDRMRGVDLSADHRLIETDGANRALLEAARDLILAELAQEG